MIRIAVALAGALILLSACAEPSAPPPAPPPPAPAQPPPPPAPAKDECEAGANQHLVGQPRSKIPVPVNPALQRVACTSCPVTMDFNPRRLNFLFDADTGLIRQVKCG